MAINIENIPRIEKRDIVTQIGKNLEARAQKGPAEPGLDAFINPCNALAYALGNHVEGHIAADVERSVKIHQLECVDARVDTYYRHLYNFVEVESRARKSPHAAAAGALLKAAFPDGLARVDDSIADENRYCRTALETLRSADFAPTVQALALPTAWLDVWEAALSHSEALLLGVSRARTEKHQHIGAGKDAEAEWVELMVRLRRYVASRATRSEMEKIQEGQALLAPLLTAVAKRKANAARRATRRENERREKMTETTD